MISGTSTVSGMVLGAGGHREKCNAAHEDCEGSGLDRRVSRVTGPPENGCTEVLWLGERGG